MTPDPSKLNTTAIRRLAAGYDGPNVITQTVPALCDEVDRLRAEVARLDKLAYLRITVPVPGFMRRFKKETS